MLQISSQQQPKTGCSVRRCSNRSSRITCNV
jgi:hypothetical protein